MAASTATSRSRARRTPRSVLWGTPSRPGRSTLPRVEHPPSTQTWGALGGGSGPACRPPPHPCLLRRANRTAYLQWSTILAKLQGGGQGADHHIPPQLMLAALATHSHIHSHAVGHSAQPDVLQRQSRGLASAPPTPRSFGEAAALPPPLCLPLIPYTYLKLNGMLLRLQGGQALAGWVGWRQEAKARQCEARSSIPTDTQAPCHPASAASDRVFGQAAPVLLRELPLTLRGPGESSKPGYPALATQPPEPSVGWGWSSGDWCGLPPSWQVPTQQLPAPAHPVLHCPDPIME